jgi:hypothetical protein
MFPDRRPSEPSHGRGGLAESRFNVPGSQAPTVEEWRRALSQVSTLFGRLVCVASLSDPETGRYTHPLLSGTLGADQAERTMRQSHRQIFLAWLNYSLADQKVDLDEYFSDGGAPLSVAQFRDLVPRSARDVERQLYLTDLETLLELRKAERSAFPIPEA